MRIDQIDGLRAIAMTMVIAQHCGLLPFGWIGVWLFFLISGYVIARSFERTAADRTVRERLSEFLRRRFWRIVPVYWLFVLANVLILLAIDGIQRLGDLPSLLTFTYNWHMIFAWWPGSSHWSPLGHLWTLSVEQQFYLLLPLIVLGLPARLQAPLMILLVASGPLVRWGWSSYLATINDDAGWRAFGVYAASHCHFDAFLMGALVARFEPYLRLRAEWSDRLWMCAIASALAYAATYAAFNHAQGARGLDTLRNVLSGTLSGSGREVFVYLAVDLLAVALLVHLLLGRTGAALLGRPIASAIGRVSYGGYLFHTLVIWLFAQALGSKPRELPTEERLLAFMVVWCATVGLASVSFRWFERPLARWALSRTSRTAGPWPREAST